MNGAGKAEVHVVAADGVVVSKPYVAKAGDTAADAGYVSARPVIAAGGGSVRYGDEVELVARKGETTDGPSTDGPAKDGAANKTGDGDSSGRRVEEEEEEVELFTRTIVEDRIVDDMSFAYGGNKEEIKSAIGAGYMKASERTALRTQINSILNSSQIANFTPDMRKSIEAELYLGIGRYTDDQSKLLTLMRQVKDTSDLKTFHTITASDNLRVITDKATPDEMRAFFTRVKNNDGENIYPMFREGSIRHIINGEINGAGSASGVHSTLSDKGEVGLVSKIDKDTGAYVANVFYDGIAKSGNGGRSTIFPEGWSVTQTIDVVVDAYLGKKPVPGKNNQYRAQVNKSIIELIVIHDQIITAYIVIM